MAIEIRNIEPDAILWTREVYTLCPYIMISNKADLETIVYLFKTEFFENIIFNTLVFCMIFLLFSFCDRNVKFKKICIRYCLNFILCIRFWLEDREESIKWKGMFFKWHYFGGNLILTYPAVLFQMSALQ